MMSAAAYRPAVILLYTAETDVTLLRVADNLGVATLQLPAPGILRESVRSVWESSTSAHAVLTYCMFGWNYTFVRHSAVSVLVCSVNSQNLLCF